MSWQPCPEPHQDGNDAKIVEAVITPRAVDLGEMTVRRALPALERQMVGPFIFFDQMGPADFPPGAGIDVRPHPHIGLSTLTYLFEGSILHRDSLGTEITIEPGAVNLMKAGRGIVHSERTPAPQRKTGQRLFGIQAWMALPVAREEDEPEFVHLSAEDLPQRRERGVTIRLIAGQAFGLKAPLTLPSPTLYAELRFEAAGSLTAEPGYEERALYIAEGAVEIGDRRFDAGRLVILQPGSAVPVSADTPARVILLGGASMGEARYIWWNLVSSRKDRIEDAARRWKEGGFPAVPGDETEFIPLPEDGTKPRKAVGGVFYP